MFYFTGNNYITQSHKFSSFDIHSTANFPKPIVQRNSLSEAVCFGRLDLGFQVVFLSVTRDAAVYNRHSKFVGYKFQCISSIVLINGSVTVWTPFGGKFPGRIPTTQPAD